MLRLVLYTCILPVLTLIAAVAAKYVFFMIRALHPYMHMPVALSLRLTLHKLYGITVKTCMSLEVYGEA